MRFAEWLIFEDIKEDFNKCAINLVEINANSLLKQALETKGFIEENTDSIVLSEVWDSSETHLSENLVSCDCSSLTSKSRVPVDCCSLKCLKDLMIQVRLGAIQQRKKDILNLEKLNDKYPRPDVAKEQMNLIKKLGYARNKEPFSRNFHPDDNASIEELKKRTAMAMKEKNEVPEEMEIYLNPSATNNFGDLLTKMFITDKKTMNRASDIFLNFVKRLTRKKVKDGVATWQNFAGLKGTLEDLEDTACDNSGGTVQGSKSGPTLNKLSQFMKAQIHGINKSPDADQLGGAVKETVTSRTAKQRIINNDLGRSKGKGQTNWGKVGNEDFSFYKSALKAHEDGDPDLIKTLNNDDKLRKEIIEDILYSKSTNKFLFPIDPPNDENIRKSLENYYTFLKGSSIRYEVEGGEDVSDRSYGKRAGYAGPRKMERSIRKGIEGVSGEIPLHADILQQLVNKEDLGMLNKMKAKLRKMLLSKNKEETHQALAFCIKYGLNCSNENPKIDKDVIDPTKKKAGLPIKEIANELSKMLNKKVDYQKARALAMGAEEKIQSNLLR